MILSFVVMLLETTPLFLMQMTMDTVRCLQKYQSSSCDMSSTLNNSSDNWMNMEVAIIAASDIPSDISTLPFVSKISLRRILNPKPVNCYLKAFVSSMGVLCIDQHLDWIPLVRIARNCYEQNIIAVLSHNNSAIVLRTTRPISTGEELKVWLSSDLIINMNIPFLKPNNIINDHCYQCHQCGLNFCQPNPLKVHLSLDCKPKCNNTMASTLTFPETIVEPQEPIRDQQNIGPTREPRSHTCLFCGKIYTRKYGLKIHVRTHTGQKPLRCRFCGRPFSDPSNLNKHVRLHSQHNSLTASPYKCKLCGKILVRRRDLERHIKSRHEASI